MFLNLKQKYMEFVAFLCLHPTFPFKHIKMDSEVALVLQNVYKEDTNKILSQGSHQLF